MTPDAKMPSDFRLTDDVLLTAYALGELDPENTAENARIEALLAADPAARRAVEEARATAADLERLFADEPAVELAPEQRERIAAASERGRVLPLRPIAAIAASLVAALGVAALGTADRDPGLDLASGQQLRYSTFEGGEWKTELRPGRSTNPLTIHADGEVNIDGTLTLNGKPPTLENFGSHAGLGGGGTQRERSDRGLDALLLRRRRGWRRRQLRARRRRLGTVRGPGEVLLLREWRWRWWRSSRRQGRGPGQALRPQHHGGWRHDERADDCARWRVRRREYREGGRTPVPDGRRPFGQEAGRDFSTLFSILRLPPADGNPPSPQVVAEVWNRLREVNPDVSYEVAVRAIERVRASARPGSEAYEPIGESRFREPRQEPLSTFSIDVDTASYSNVRRFLEAGQLPPPDAVRLEEMVNYFSYDDPTPGDGQPFATRVEIAGCPWNTANRLVRIGLRAKDVGGDLPAMNVVFLIDVSGSMQSDDKLPLLKRGMKLLAGQMREQDRVGIVTYASNSGIALPSTTGAERDTITGCIDALSAGGSTNGGAGIQQAYEMARQHFVKGGVNRVVLATDGDFNVGVTDKSELVQLIQREAQSGVFLTVLGFGTGNIKDATLEQIADKGNGQYAYIDGLREARRVLVERMRGTLVTVAKDVKIQVEFNPARVASYRLLGYENRVLAAADFNDDQKDAGEIGAGHSVTALYEVVPVGAPPAQGVDELRYQPRRPISPVQADDTASHELLAVKLRYKQPDATESTKIEIPVTDAGTSYAQASSDLKFAASVAMFGMLLRNSPTRGTASYDAILELGGEALGEDPRGYRAQFLDLVLKAKTLSRR